MEWTTLEKFLTNLTYIGLATTMLFYWLSLILFNSKWIFKIARYGAIFANIILFLHLLARWINAKYFPLSNLYESLLFLCWSLLFGHLLIETKTRSKLIGAMTVPIVLLLNVFATLTLPPEMQKIIALVPSLQSNWLMMHVSMMMISYATLILGSLLCILYLLLNRKKSTKDESKTTNLGSTSYFLANNRLFDFTNSKEVISEISVLNSKNRTSLLDILDSWSYRIIGFGFPLLSIGIISGAVWANEAWGSYWSWDPKETWALITWLVFAAYLHARLTKGWKGEKTALLGTAGFFVIWICYLGVNFLGKGLHSYGWLS